MTTSGHVRTQPLEDGYRAYKKGKPLAACPFTSDWWMRGRWMHGWVSAYHNRSKQR